MRDNLATLGMVRVRVLRNVATLLTLTDSLVMFELVDAAGGL